MKNIYKKTSFPPNGPWDERMTNACCTDLSPVIELHSNPWFSVIKRANFYTTEFKNSQVAILPVVDGVAFVMVRVKRPILNDITLELPAGGAEEGESPEFSAARELFEESGILINDLSRIKPMPPLSLSPTRMPTLLYVFRIDLTKEEYDNRKMHDSEIDSVCLVPFDEAIRLITVGGIYVSGIVAILGTFLLQKSPTSPSYY
jgi:8-oxo-dGTP pyrophosphatase MutT (NUDIX family)